MPRIGNPRLRSAHCPGDRRDSPVASRLLSERRFDGGLFLASDFQSVAFQFVASSWDRRARLAAHPKPPKKKTADAVRVGGFFVMGPEGLEPPTNQLCFPLRLSPSLSSAWAGLSLHPRGVPAVESLHLRESQTIRAWLGITLPASIKLFMKQV